MKYHILFLIAFFSNILYCQNTLNTYTEVELKEDYDLMVSSLKEAHTGLYWYTSYPEFEKIFKENRDKIKEEMHSYVFFRIISLVTAADKEGHSSIGSSKDIGKFYNEQARFLPFGIKVIGKQIYLLNNLNKKKTKGFIIKEINNINIDSIIKKIFNHTSRSSDGFTVTGKYKGLERFGFSNYYTDYIIDFSDRICKLKILNPNTKETEIINLTLVDGNGLKKIAKQIPRPIKRKKNLFEFSTDSSTKTSTLIFNSFSYGRYKKQNLDFRTVVDSLFQIIRKNKTKNLIIDVRNNGGGSEGAEDYLFSYLTEKPYVKYKYVEASSFNYSFIKHTNYKDDVEELYGMLKEEHYLSKDGRVLRKKDVLPTVLPQKNTFKGEVYILISGKTYSGGSEFASIAKEHSDAIFIGEETGGGFYGQTSGSYVKLTLPNTNMKVRIPLLKFATNFESKNIPFGHGVIPNYKIEQTFEEYENGIDSALNYVLRKIENK